MQASTAPYARRRCGSYARSQRCALLLDLWARRSTATRQYCATCGVFLGWRALGAAPRRAASASDARRPTPRSGPTAAAATPTCVGPALRRPTGTAARSTSFERLPPAAPTASTGRRRRADRDRLPAPRAARSTSRDRVLRALRLVPRVGRARRRPRTAARAPDGGARDDRPRRPHPRGRDRGRQSRAWSRSRRRSSTAATERRRRGRGSGSSATSLANYARTMALSRRASSRRSGSPPTGSSTWRCPRGIGVDARASATTSGCTAGRRRAGAAGLIEYDGGEGLPYAGQERDQRGARAGGPAPRRVRLPPPGMSGRRGLRPDAPMKRSDLLAYVRAPARARRPARAGPRGARASSASRRTRSATARATTPAARQALRRWEQAAKSEAAAKGGLTANPPRSLETHAGPTGRVGSANPNVGGSRGRARPCGLRRRTASFGRPEMGALRPLAFVRAFGPGGGADAGARRAPDGVLSGRIDRCVAVGMPCATWRRRWRTLPRGDRVPAAGPAQPDLPAADDPGDGEPRRVGDGPHPVPPGGLAAVPRRERPVRARVHRADRPGHRARPPPRPEDDRGAVLLWTLAAAGTLGAIGAARPHRGGQDDDRHPVLRLRLQERGDRQPGLGPDGGPGATDMLVQVGSLFAAAGVVVAALAFGQRAMPASWAWLSYCDRGRLRDRGRVERRRRARRPRAVADDRADRRPGAGVGPVARGAVRHAAAAPGLERTVLASGTRSPL